MTSLYNDFNPDWYYMERRGDNLYEYLTHARGLSVLYLSPSDNPLGDSNIANLLCEEMKSLRGLVFATESPTKFYFRKVVDVNFKVSIKRALGGLPIDVLKEITKLPKGNVTWTVPG